MEKHTLLSYTIPTNLPRILISFMVLTSFVFLSVTPVIAASLEITLNQPTQSKTEPPTQVTLTETTSLQAEDAPSVPDEASPEEVIEPVVTDTGIVLNENTNQIIITSENTTLTAKTKESVALTEIQSNTSSSFSSSGLSTEEEPTPTVQQVTCSILPLTNTDRATDVNAIDVTTSQSYKTVTAEISISNDKPLYAPPITLENEKQFIDSYITIQLTGDSITLSEEQIQSMTMILKIKKNPDDHFSSSDAHIYVLTYEANPLFSQSRSLIQETIVPFNSGLWQPLVPIEITEDDEYVYYHVETPSYFATFAVVGTELVEMQPYQTGIPQIPWAAIILTIILATTLLIFVMFKTGFIYQVEDSSVDKKKEKSFKETNQKWSYKVKLSAMPPELQLSRPPTLYFSTAPCPPQVMTASTQLQESSDEGEDDPMYL